MPEYERIRRTESAAVVDQDDPTYLDTKEEARMRIVLIGATGTVGAAVGDALAKRGHQVIGASRKSGERVDIEDAATIRALFDRLKDIAAVVCCAGSARFEQITKLTDDDFSFSLQSKLMGQVNVVRIAKDRVKDGGSITLTSGILATRPMQGSSAISLVNAGLEGFVRAAGLEMTRGVRVNIVSPPWVKETLRARKMDDSNGLAADEVAKAYVAAVEGKSNGAVLDAAALAE
jgi:NAD(P)-dependent dehydrogenase (short-subunit alcohol dehydrogenase family)